MPVTTFEEADQAIGALQTAIQSLLRKDVGLIILSASPTPPPDCVACDGQLYDITQPENSRLRDLCETIGKTFGGDGVTTFRVPELRGEFVRVWDDGKRPDRVVDTDRLFGSFQDWSTGMPRAALTTGQNGEHNHGGSTGGQSQTHSHSATASGSSAQGGPNSFESGDERGVHGVVSVSIGHADRDHTHGISGSGTHNHSISGGDGETRPRNVALAAYIRF